MRRLSLSFRKNINLVFALLTLFYTVFHIFNPPSCVPIYKVSYILLSLIIATQLLDGHFEFKRINRRVSKAMDVAWKEHMMNYDNERKHIKR